MSFNTVPTVATGDLWTAANQNTYLRDNMAALFPYTTAGDIAVASAADALTRLALGDVGQVLKVLSGPALGYGSPIHVEYEQRTSLYAVTTSWADITDLSVSITTDFDNANVVVIGAGKIKKGVSWAGVRAMIDSVADADPVYSYQSEGEIFGYVHHDTVASASTFDVSLQAIRDASAVNIEHARMLVLVF
jgi:hypothetical protein